MANINVVTPQNVGGIIKRINERIADIGRRGAEGLGTDSYLYERYEKALNMMLPAQMRGTSQAGFIKIRNDKETRALLLSDEYGDVLQKIGNYETRGKFRKRKAKTYKEKYGVEPTDKELTEMIKANKEYKKAYENGKIQDKYNELTDEELAILHKSFNSWEEINAIMARLFGDKPTEDKKEISKQKGHVEKLSQKSEKIKIGKGENFRFD